MAVLPTELHIIKVSMHLRKSFKHKAQVIVQISWYCPVLFNYCMCRLQGGGWRKEKNNRGKRQGNRIEDMGYRERANEGTSSGQIKNK